MEKTVRLWFAVAGLICAALAVASWWATIHVYLMSPEIHEIVLPADVQGKGFFLFFPLFFMTVLLLMALYPSLRWTHFIARFSESLNTKDIWASEEAGNKVTTIAIAMCIAMCVLGALIFYVILQRVALINAMAAHT